MTTILRALEQIGNTPLVPLRTIAAHLVGVRILAKVEWGNPGGSSKDRSAPAIVADARRRGLLNNGKRLLDASSGNAGVSYAMLGAVLGFPVTLCMPEDISPTRKKIISGFGAEVVYTAADLGLDGAILKAREMAGDDAQRYCYVDQFSNDANWLAHYQSTGTEIWQQTEGRVTHFVAAMGSSGTFVGTTRKLKQYNSKVQCIGLQPDSPIHGLHGMKHISTTLLPAIYSPYIADQILTVGTEEAREMALRLAREENLPAGISGAAAVVACLKIAEECALTTPAGGKELVIVGLLTDAAERYDGE